MGLKEILFGEDEQDTKVEQTTASDNTGKTGEGATTLEGDDAVRKDQLVGEIIQKHPSAASFLMDCGMECIFCPASQNESLEEACMVHGIDAEEIVTALNEKLAAEA